MSKKNKQLIIFGTKSYAEIVHQYFTFDSDYEVVAFTADEQYITSDTFLGLPVIPFETIETTYPPEQYEIHVAVVYGKLNKIRETICKRAKDKGYKLASYISSKAFVWRNVSLGEHCFIFEDNTIQPFVTIEDNVILWSGNHIGHHSTIASHNFISSHVVISGHCQIGSHCFFGVNSTVGNHVIIGNNCWISPNSMTTKDIEPYSLIKSLQNTVHPLDEEKLFKTLEKIGM